MVTLQETVYIFAMLPAEQLTSKETVPAAPSGVHTSPKPEDLIASQVFPGMSEVKTPEGTGIPLVSEFEGHAESFATAHVA